MATTDQWIDTFIDRSFRDVADEDYLAARIAYRYDLLHRPGFAVIAAARQVR